MRIEVPYDTLSLKKTKYRSGLSVDPMLNKDQAVQCVKYELSAEGWKKAMGKEPSAKYHVSSMRHAIIVPGGKGYPHLTIDIDAMQFTRDRRLLKVEFSRAHYSSEERGFRIAFSDQGRGQMKAEGYVPRNMDKILSSIQSWIGHLLPNLVFTDDKGRDVSQIKKERGFFQQESPKPVKKESGSPQPTTLHTPEIPVFEHKNPFESMEVESMPMVKGVPKINIGAVGEGKSEAKAHSESPKSKKGKRKKKKLAEKDDLGTEEGWEKMLREVESISPSTTPESSPTPRHRKHRKAVASPTASPLSIVVSDSEKIARLKEWEEFLSIEDFDDLFEEPDLSSLSQEEMSQVFGVYNECFEKKGKFSLKQNDRMLAKIGEMTEKMQKLRRIMSTVKSIGGKKQRGKELFSKGLEELRVESEKLVPTDLHWIRPRHLVPDAVERKTEEQLSALKLAIALMFKTMNITFMKLRMQEYFGMGLASLNHLKEVSGEFAPAFSRCFEHCFDIMNHFNAVIRMDPRSGMPSDALKNPGEILALQQRQNFVMNKVQWDIDFFGAISERMSQIVQNTHAYESREWDGLWEVVKPLAMRIPKVNPDSHIPHSQGLDALFFEFLEKIIQNSSA